MLATIIVIFIVHQRKCNSVRGGCFCFGLVWQGHWHKLIQRSFRRKAINYLVRWFFARDGWRFVKQELDPGEYQKLLMHIRHWMIKKAKRNLNRLIGLLTRAVCLRVILDWVGWLNFELCKKSGSKLSEEFRVPIRNKHGWKALVNKI